MKKRTFILTALAAGAVAIAGTMVAIGQQSAPSELPGCVYNASGVTLSDKQSVVIQCDVNGKIQVH